MKKIDRNKLDFPSHGTYLTNKKPKKSSNSQSGGQGGICYQELVGGQGGICYQEFYALTKFSWVAATFLRFYMCLCYYFLFKMRIEFRTPTGYSAIAMSHSAEFT